MGLLTLQSGNHPFWYCAVFIVARNVGHMLDLCVKIYYILILDSEHSILSCTVETPNGQIWLIFHSITLCDAGTCKPTSQRHTHTHTHTHTHYAFGMSENLSVGWEKESVQRERGKKGWQLAKWMKIKKRREKWQWSGGHRGSLSAEAKESLRQAASVLLLRPLCLCKVHVTRGASLQGQTHSQATFSCT